MIITLWANFVTITCYPPLLMLAGGQNTGVGSTERSWKPSWMLTLSDNPTVVGDLGDYEKLQGIMELRHGVETLEENVSFNHDVLTLHFLFL